MMLVSDNNVKFNLSWFVKILILLIFLPYVEPNNYSIAQIIDVKKKQINNKKTAQTTGDAIESGVTSAGAASKALFKKFDSN